MHVWLPFPPSAGARLAAGHREHAALLPPPGLSFQPRTRAAPLVSPLSRGGPREMGLLLLPGRGVPPASRVPPLTRLPSCNGHLPAHVSSRSHPSRSDRFPPTLGSLPALNAQTTSDTLNPRPCLSDSSFSLTTFGVSCSALPEGRLSMASLAQQAKSHGPLKRQHTNIPAYLVAFSHKSAATHGTAKPA